MASKRRNNYPYVRKKLWIDGDITINTNASEDV